MEMALITPKILNHFQNEGAELDFAVGVVFFVDCSSWT